MSKQIVILDDLELVHESELGLVVRRGDNSTVSLPKKFSTWVESDSTLEIEEWLAVREGLV